MTFFSKTLACIAAALVLATSAVIAEPPTPLLSYYQGGELVQERRMTPPEHTALMKLQLAMGALNPEQSAEAMTQKSIELAAESLETLAEGIVVTQSASGEATNIDIDFSFEQLAQAVGEGGEQIGRYAERIGKAAESLESEIRKNSEDIEFDSIAIGEGEERFHLTIDSD